MSKQRIIPMLAYQDAKAAIDFLVKAFGFEETFRLDMKDGTVGHAEVGYQDNIVMLATAWESAGLFSPQKLTGVAHQIHCEVDDVDAHHRRAVAAGATIAAPPEDQFHGSRIYRAVDPEGHRWIFSQKVRDVSMDEMEPHT